MRVVSGFGSDHPGDVQELLDDIPNDKPKVACYEHVEDVKKEFANDVWMAYRGEGLLSSDWVQMFADFVDEKNLGGEFYEFVEEYLGKTKGGK